MKDQGFNSTAVDESLRADAADIVAAGYNLRGKGKILQSEDLASLIRKLPYSGLDGSRKEYQHPKGSDEQC